MAVEEEDVVLGVGDIAAMMVYVLARSIAVVEANAMSSVAPVEEDAAVEMEKEVRFVIFEKGQRSKSRK